MVLNFEEFGLGFKIGTHLRVHEISTITAFQVDHRGQGLIASI